MNTGTYKNFHTQQPESMGTQHNIHKQPLARLEDRTPGHRELPALSPHSEGEGQLTHMGPQLYEQPLNIATG